MYGPGGSPDDRDHAPARDRPQGRAAHRPGRRPARATRARRARGRHRAVLGLLRAARREHGPRGAGVRGRGRGQGRGRRRVRRRSRTRSATCRTWRGRWSSWATATRRPGGPGTCRSWTRSRSAQFLERAFAVAGTPARIRVDGPMAVRLAGLFMPMAREVRRRAVPVDAAVRQRLVRVRGCVRARSSARRWTRRSRPRSTGGASGPARPVRLSRHRPEPIRDEAPHGAVGGATVGHPGRGSAWSGILGVRWIDTDHPHRHPPERGAGHPSVRDGAGRPRRDDGRDPGRPR